MENLENKEIEIVEKPTKKAAGTSGHVLTELEINIIARSEDLNLPSLASFFGITEDEVKNALAKK
jgi:hypothetical protein